MLVLGIDPGTATTGYGLIKVEVKDLVPIKHGLIETKKHHSPERRLHTINGKLSSIIEKYQPNILAMEKVFFSSNVKTAIRVGQAQGVILYTAATYRVPVVEYAPGTIKKQVTGNGRSDKKQMQQAVKDIFDGKIVAPKGRKTHFDNEADALAIALCHIFKTREEMFVPNL